MTGLDWLWVAGCVSILVSVVAAWWLVVTVWRGT